MVAYASTPEHLCLVSIFSTAGCGAILASTPHLAPRTSSFTASWGELLLLVHCNEPTRASPRATAPQLTPQRLPPGRTHPGPSAAAHGSS